MLTGLHSPMHKYSLVQAVADRSFNLILTHYKASHSHMGIIMPHSLQAQSFSPCLPYTRYSAVVIGNPQVGRQSHLRQGGTAQYTRNFMQYRLRINLSKNFQHNTKGVPFARPMFSPKNHESDTNRYI